jgi:hypothetical protein
VLLLPPQEKNTPLHLAADKGHKDVAELLLGHKADVNSVDDVSADGCAGEAVGVLKKKKKRKKLRFFSKDSSV